MLQNAFANSIVSDPGKSEAKALAADQGGSNLIKHKSKGIIYRDEQDKQDEIHKLNFKALWF